MFEVKFCEIGMTSNTDLSRKLHRRETWLYLIVPMIAVGVMILASVGSVLLLPRPEQISLIAAWMSTILVYCPAVLCLFALCIFCIAAVAGLQKVHTQAARPLDRLGELSRAMTEKTIQTSEVINQKTAQVSAVFDEWLDAFESPPTLPTEGKENHDDTTLPG